MDIATSPLASIGIDIGKDVFHIIGFGTDGKIAYRQQSGGLTATRWWPPYGAAMGRSFPWTHGKRLLSNGLP